MNNTNKNPPSYESGFLFGAGSRGRTDTVLLPSDFESDASANSTIPAWCVDLINGCYYNISFRKNQELKEKILATRVMIP